MSGGLLLDEKLLTKFLQDWTMHLGQRLGIAYRSVDCLNSMQALLDMRVHTYLPSFSTVDTADGPAGELQFPPVEFYQIAPSKTVETWFLQFGTEKPSQFEILPSQMPQLLLYADRLTDVARSAQRRPISGLEFELVFLVQRLRWFHRHQKHLPFLEVEPAAPTVSTSSERPLIFALTGCKFSAESCGCSEL